MKFSIVAPLAVAALATAAPSQPISSRTTTSGTTTWTTGDTASDVENGVCAPITVIFARGSGEKGNIGKRVGPYLFSALVKQHGTNIALQGVDYNATWKANEELGAEGENQMTSLVKKAQSQCSETKIALGGYSQGGMVLHKALGDLKAGDVAAAVAFGDPYNGLIPGSIDHALFKEFCGEGDNLCHHHGATENVTSHLAYGKNNGTEAAKFLLDNISSGGGSNVIGSIVGTIDDGIGDLTGLGTS